MSPHARLAFQGLWLHADREGRLRDEPGRLRVRIFPYEPQVDMNACLEALVGIRCITRYAVDGQPFIAIPGFLGHQNPHPKEAASRIPPPPSPVTAVESHGKTRQAANAPGSMKTLPVSPEGSGSGKGSAALPPPLPSRQTIIPVKPPWAVYAGQRLKVPQAWHDNHVPMLGGSDAHARLLAWYEELDASLVRSQTPVKDWFKWMDACYLRWAPDPPQSDVPDVNETRRRYLS